MESRIGNRRAFRRAAASVFVGVLLVGCGSTKEEKKQDAFFTSGSREADQRASQRMAKEDQLAGTGKKGDVVPSKPGEPAHVEQKLTLYERLGGEQGITRIVDDFIARALQDPRVNWSRRGVGKGGFFGFGKTSPDAEMWAGGQEQVATLKRHFVQFLSLATGGPPQYDGREMTTTHSSMRITNPEFDATVGDLKASLDRLQIADREQKELLAIIESTRPQIVSER